MTNKKGTVKITTVMSSDTTKTQIYNMVEKTDGAYTETLTELISMETVYTDESGSHIVDSANEAGQGYKVFPMKTASDKVNEYKNSSSDTVEWTTALSEVTA